MSEWITHSGGERPVRADTKVQVQVVGGNHASGTSLASFWHWTWGSGSPKSGDIIAYRLVEEREEPAPEKTGGSTPNQYRISVNLPLTEDRTKFVQVDLEAMDVIDALDLSGNLKDVLKALFRLDKKEGVSTEYDLTKSVFYLVREMKKRGFISHAKFWEISEYISKVLKEK